MFASEEDGRSLDGDVDGIPFAPYNMQQSASGTFVLCLAKAGTFTTGSVPGAASF